MEGISSFQREFVVAPRALKTILNYAVNYRLVLLLAVMLAFLREPLNFIIASVARTVTQGAPELLRLSCNMVDITNKRPLVLADIEYFCAALFETDHQCGMDSLVPQPLYLKQKQAILDLPTDGFTSHWAGFATAVRPFEFHNVTQRMNLL